MKIVIVGGGLGGFAVGIGLLQHGFTDVIVYERDVAMDSRRQGYGLTILQGISALKRLNVLKEVEDLDTPSRSHYIFEKDGRMIGFFGTAFWPEQDNQLKTRKKHNLHIGRQELRRILMERYIALHPFGEHGIQWNHRLMDIDRKSRQVRFSNQHTIEEVDLIIGADGINTQVRPFKYGPSRDVSLNYLGILVVLGITGEIDHFLMKDRVFQTMDGCFRLFAMPFSKFRIDHAMMWQLSFPIDLNEAIQYSRDPASLKNFLLEKCADWHPPIPEMIEKTQHHLLMGIPAFDRDLIQQPPDDQSLLPIALIGDAAHPMSPFKGQGANQALLDAVDLGDLIFQYQKELTRAVDQYEQRMVNRVLSKVLQSRERVTSFHRREALLTENFLYRGVDETLINELNRLNINAHWNQSIKSIEQAITEHLTVFDTKKKESSINDIEST